MENEVSKTNDCPYWCMLCGGDYREGHLMTYRHMASAVRFCDMVAEKIATHWYHRLGLGSSYKLDVGAVKKIVKDLEDAGTAASLTPDRRDAAIAKLFLGCEEAERLPVQEYVRTLYRGGDEGIVTAVVGFSGASAILVTLPPEIEEPIDEREAERREWMDE